MGFSENCVPQNPMVYFGGKSPIVATKRHVLFPLSHGLVWCPRYSRGIQCDHWDVLWSLQSPIAGWCFVFMLNSESIFSQVITVTIYFHQIIWRTFFHSSGSISQRTPLIPWIPRSWRTAAWPCSPSAASWRRTMTRFRYGGCSHQWWRGLSMNGD